MLQRLFISGLALVLALTQALPAEALTATRQPGGDPALINLLARAAARRAARMRADERVRQNPPISAKLVQQRRSTTSISQRTVRRYTSIASSSSSVSTMSVLDAQRANALFELTNKERVKAGLRPLRRNSLLDLAAQRHAEDMKRNNYFEHKNLRGELAGDRIQKTGYAYLGQGENIASGQVAETQVILDWLESPPHRANMLHADFDEIGIGVAGNWWVQNFAQSKIRFESPVNSETELLTQVNMDRVAAAVLPVKLDDRLDQVAAAIVANMRAKEAFIYKDAAGNSIQDLLLQNGFLQGQPSFSILQFAVSGNFTAREAAAKFLQSDKAGLTDIRQRSAGVAVSGLYWFVILADK